MNVPNTGTTRRAGHPMTELDRFIEALRDASDDFPSLRIGQLIVNAMPEAGLYYIEDAELVKAIENYVEAV